MAKSALAVKPSKHSVGIGSTRLAEYVTTNHGSVFDLQNGNLEHFALACREEKGLADAVGLLSATAEKADTRTGCPKAVYVIQVADDPIAKIGVSANPFQRVIDLQGAHYRELFLYGVVFVPGRKSVTLEQEVLSRATANGSRLMGEWIADEPWGVLLEVLKVARDHKIDVCDGDTWFKNMLERTKSLYRMKQDHDAAYRQFTAAKYRRRRA